MDPDIVIAAFKITAALRGGVLGVIGVLFTFKRPDGRITGWGVAVLVGIVASSFAGVLGSVAEGYKARSEAKQQAARTQQLLREINRAIQPIGQVEITYWTPLPSDSALVKGYLARVSKGVDAMIGALQQVFDPREGVKLVDMYRPSIERERTHRMAAGAD